MANVNLNKRCRIEQKTTTTDEDYGTEVITWSLLTVCWCEVLDVLPSKSESVKNGLAVAANQARIRLRYRTDIDSSMRMNINGITYQIIAGPATIKGGQYIELMAEKYSSNG